MKRIFVLFIVWVTFSGNSYAQVFEDTRKLQFAISLQPTLNWLKIKSNDIAADGARLGFGYGMSVDYYFSENRQRLFSSGIFSNQVRLKYAILDSLSGMDVATKVNIRYLNIPLSLKLKTVEIGYLTYFAQFGAAPAFAIRSRYSQEANGIVDADAKDLTHLFNVFFTTGIGVEYSIKKSTKLFGGIYYNTGFLDAISDINGSVKPRYVALRAGILF